MSYVYAEVDKLQGQPKVGDGDCVDLVKQLTPGIAGLSTTAWRQGASVRATRNLFRGTAIATFEDGKYPKRKSGQHAAFFLKHAGAGFWIMDQWTNDPEKTISSRHISPKGKNPDGSYKDRSNNADAFSVIELGR